MKTHILPESWRESLDDLREDLAHSVDRWLRRMKPEERDKAVRELAPDFWHRPITRFLNQPEIDLEEHDDVITVRADLPGMDKENLEVDLEGRLLTIHGEKEESRDEKRGRTHVSERRFGSFTRTIALPCEVERSGVKAKYRRGVLKLTLPKTETARARRIPVAYEED